MAALLFKIKIFTILSSSAHRGVWEIYICILEIPEQVAFFFNRSLNHTTFLVSISEAAALK